MSDHLAAHLRLGPVLRRKRWSGDTHADLGGSIDEEATDALMALAADEIERLSADLTSGLRRFKEQLAEIEWLRAAIWEHHPCPWHYLPEGWRP